MTDPDAGASSPIDETRFRWDLRSSIQTALAGIGTAARGKRPTYAVKTDQASLMAPMVVAHLMRSGWSFRHWTWPEGRFVGQAGSPPPAPSTGRTMTPPEER